MQGRQAGRREERIYFWFLLSASSPRKPCRWCWLAFLLVRFTQSGRSEPKVLENSLQMGKMRCGHEQAPLSVILPDWSRARI